MTSAYPLTWPDHIARSKTRDSGRFSASLVAAIKNVEDSLRLFGENSGKKLSKIVISSNYSLTERRPADPGVAVWFTWDEMQVCIPVDRYSLIEANLQAIHHIIEARRVELRHGTLALVRATFRGFVALPPPSTRKRSWREVLGYSPTAVLDPATIKSFYKTAAKKAHPDQGGSHDAMAEVNRAHDEAMKEFSQ